MAVSPPQVELVVRREGHPERRLLLGMGATHLGRAEDNDLVLPDIGVSRRHARILVDPNGVTVEDMGSGNGTWFRGQRVRRQALGDGDEVSIDPFTLSFRLRTGPPAEAAVGPGGRVDEDATARLGGAAAGESPFDARIVTLTGQRLASTYPIRGNRLTMGRSEGRDVVLFDPAASRRHCEIVTRGGEFWLLDDASANGTFVNTRRVRECLLQPGDRIRIGTTEFRFEPVSADSPTPPPEPAARPTSPRRPRPPLQDRPTSEFLTLDASVSASGQRPRAPRRQGSGALRIALQVAAVGFIFGVALFALVAVILAFNWQRVSELVGGLGGPPPVEVPASAQLPEPAPEPDPAVAYRTGILLDEGMTFFQQTRYLDAASQFYKVLQKDPGHAEAERMGYVACEYIALDTMRDAMLRRTVPAEEQKSRRKAALSLGDKAVGGKAELAEARRALDEAAAFFPDDAKVRTALEAVLAAEAKERSDKRLRTHRSKVEKLYKLARKEADAGNHAAAIVAYEGVMAADPEKRTHSWYDARDGVIESKARLAAAAQPELDAGLAAHKAGELGKAREHLEQALAVDPYSESAKSALAQVQRELRARAETTWAAAQAKEATGDKAGAIAGYREVISAVGPEDELGRKAAARLEALGG